MKIYSLMKASSMVILVTLLGCGTETPSPEPELNYLSGLFNDQIESQVVANTHNLTQQEIGVLFQTLVADVEAEFELLKANHKVDADAQITIEINIAPDFLVFVSASIDSHPGVSNLTNRPEEDCPNRTGQTNIGHVDCADAACAWEYMLPFAADGCVGTTLQRRENGNLRVCFYECIT